MKFKFKVKDKVILGKGEVHVVTGMGIYQKPEIKDGKTVQNKDGLTKFVEGRCYTVNPLNPAGTYSMRGCPAVDEDKLMSPSEYKAALEADLS